MKTQFTKGDWSFEITDKLGIYSGKKCVSLIAMPQYSNTDEYENSKKEALANAKLISTAPELLVSLINAVEFIDKCPYLSEVDKPMGLENWKKRIKKATE